MQETQFDSWVREDLLEKGQLRSGLPFGPRSQASLQKAQGPGVCKLQGWGQAGWCPVEMRTQGALTCLLLLAVSRGRRCLEALPSLWTWTQTPPGDVGQSPEAARTQSPVLSST